MLAIVKTRWPDSNDGMTLIDFDESRVKDEEAATQLIHNALYGLAVQNPDMTAGELVSMLGETELAEIGATPIDKPFMVVEIGGYDSPLRTYTPPKSAAKEAKMPPAPQGVDENDLNRAIKFHALPYEEMISAGFSVPYDDADYYYLCERIESTITFNVHVPMDETRGRIDVLDEEFCQPYDYQLILSKQPHHPFATKIRNAVEEQMALLEQAGIVTGHIPGEYI